MRRSESDTRTHSCHKNTLALDEYRWFISSGKGARVSLWHCVPCGGGGAPGRGGSRHPGKAKAQGQAARGPSRARPALARAPGPRSPGRTAPVPSHVYFLVPIVFATSPFIARARISIP